MNTGYINPNAKKLIKQKKASPLKIDSLSSQIIHGDTSALARAITLVESNKPSDKIIAKKLILSCNHTKSKSVIIGITGSPGVGKSSFIESFGLKLLEDTSVKIAVLTYDPVSPIKGGSILGDKTRMQNLSNHARAFVRPSPSDLHASIHDSARNTITLCQTAAYDYIIIETVGTGQSELAIQHLVDYTLLLINPNSGDELQGIKRGIMEIADLIVVNKDDSGMEAAAKNTQAEYLNAIKLLDKKNVKVLRCSSVYHKGIDQIKSYLLENIKLHQKNGALQRKRKNQRKEYMKFLIARQVNKSLESLFKTNTFKSELQLAQTFTSDITSIAEKYIKKTENLKLDSSL